jgi:hypothetical protein
MNSHDESDTYSDVHSQARSLSVVREGQARINCVATALSRGRG